MQNFYVEEENLSIGWAKAFLNTINKPGGEINPLIVKITGFNNNIAIEDDKIRMLINNNEILKKKFYISKDYIETVAGTIFPQSLWNMNMERNILYNRYLKTYPKMKQVRANSNGMYFHRLIAFDNGDKNPVNQLEHIIKAYRNRCHRRSALQASIFDPRKDHSIQPQRGFPCLQQIAFSPLGSNGNQGLRITGFYAKQLILEKAYGNYLGLARLGNFMVKEMGIELKEMICIASVASYAERSQFSKTTLKSFKNELEKILKMNKKG